jgi:hypothetical protein
VSTSPLASRSFNPLPNALSIEVRQYHGSAQTTQGQFKKSGIDLDGRNFADDFGTACLKDWGMQDNVGKEPG